MAQTYKKCADTIEALFHDNVKLKSLIREINEREDVTDDLREYILLVINGKKGTH